ncbi:MAG: hypothetical protein HYY31_02550, partial [Chloroflexi bacterium]|nr:hypothetical protein [Chloroflexota bacterium]
MQKVVVDDLESLLHVLPSRIEDCLLGFKDLPGLLEVVLDRGRPPLA